MLSSQVQQIVDNLCTEAQGLVAPLMTLAVLMCAGCIYGSKFVQQWRGQAVMIMLGTVVSGFIAMKAPQIGNMIMGWIS